MIPRFKPWLGSRELREALCLGRAAVGAFEQAFARHMGVEHAIAFPYGRSALWAFLRAVNVNDQEIVIPAYTCSVVGHAVVLSGNRPRFVDVRLSDYTMDPACMAEAMGPSVRVVVPTHLFGYPMDLGLMDGLVRDAEKRSGQKLWVIHDCAHSFAAQSGGRSVLQAGDAAFVGLGISKLITSLQGGMIVTESQELATTLHDFRNAELALAPASQSLGRLLYLVAVLAGFSRFLYGAVHWLEAHTTLLDSLTKAYHLDDQIHFPPGAWRRLSELEARVGLAQLRRYDEIIQRRRDAAAQYDALLRDIPGLTLPPLVDGATYSHYVPRVEHRAEVISSCQSSGLQLGDLIQYSLPLTTPYQQWSNGMQYPNAEHCSRTAINLPIYAGLSPSDRERISDTLRKALCENGTTARGSHASAEFDRHWSGQDGEGPATVKVEEAARFLDPVLALLEKRGTRVLDVGCGDGAHWQCIRRVAHPEVMYTGIDVSGSAIDALRRRAGPSDRFEVLGAERLTELAGPFDVVFAFGVLGYTEDPEQCFSQMCRVCRPGGYVGLWLAPPPQGGWGTAFRWTRALCRRLGPWGTARVADAIVPLLPWLPTRSEASLRNSTWRQCREIVLVNLAPRRLVFVREAEVHDWCERNGIQLLEVSSHHPVTVWGRNGAQRNPVHQA